MPFEVGHALGRDVGEKHRDLVIGAFGGLGLGRRSHDQAFARDHCRSGGPAVGAGYRDLDVHPQSRHGGHEMV